MKLNTVQGKLPEFSKLSQSLLKSNDFEFVVFLLSFLLCYYVLDLLYNWLYPSRTIIKVKQTVKQLKVKQPVKQNRVYHFNDVKLNYNQAKSFCKSAGLYLATKTQLEQQHKLGGHWCSLGWIDGQQAYYPIQGNSLDCGKHGLNGGTYSPDTLLGVNCSTTK